MKPDMAPLGTFAVISESLFTVKVVQTPMPWASGGFGAPASPMPGLPPAAKEPPAPLPCRNPPAPPFGSGTGAGGAPPTPPPDGDPPDATPASSFGSAMITSPRPPKHTAFTPVNPR